MKKTCRPQLIFHAFLTARMFVCVCVNVCGIFILAFVCKRLTFGCQCARQFPLLIVDMTDDTRHCRCPIKSNSSYPLQTFQTVVVESTLSIHRLVNRKMREISNSIVSIQLGKLSALLAVSTAVSKRSTHAQRNCLLIYSFILKPFHFFFSMSDRLNRPQ